MTSESPIHKLHPTPEQIKTHRTQNGLTQREAAEMVCSTARRWIEWESGIHKMHPGLWKLFQIKINSERRPIAADPNMVRSIRGKKATTTALVRGA